MKVIINELNWDMPFLLNLPSRPNVGDGIWLNDLKLKNVHPVLMEAIKDSTRFIVTDVVYGKFLPFNRNRWVIQGQLDEALREFDTTLHPQ
jgi:hypothetical protein